ncbi:MAG TPA: LysM domain-containing protein [Burkholderiales bacterium]|nr:LysM domain-containing protein [Burkholderiales bacterium]
MDRHPRLDPDHVLARAARLRVLAVALAGACLGLVLGAATPGLAQEGASGQSMSVPLAADAPDTYVVKPGDTLWDISAVFLRDPWYWPEIWYVNPAIENPHLIYPGDVLHLVYVDGRPRVMVGRAGDVRLSPQVRSQPLSQAVRAIPYDLLMNFVGRPQLLTKEEVKEQPYVVGIRDRHIIGSTENELYGRGLESPAVGTRYSIINIGRQLEDPDDGDLLGYIGHYAGTAQVIDNTGDDDDALAHMRVVEAGREVLQGDKLFPALSNIGPDFQLSAPAKEDLDGRVVAIVDGVYAAGRYQVMAINRGARDGLAPGNVVGIFAAGEQVRDRGNRATWRAMSTNYAKVRLPTERSGTLLLFTVHDRISYGLVVESTIDMRVGDYIKHPSVGHRDTGLATSYGS